MTISRRKLIHMMSTTMKMIIKANSMVLYQQLCHSTLSSVFESTMPAPENNLWVWYLHTYLRSHQVHRDWNRGTGSTLHTIPAQLRIAVIAEIARALPRLTKSSLGPSHSPNTCRILFSCRRTLAVHCRNNPTPTSIGQSRASHDFLKRT